MSRAIDVSDEKLEERAARIHRFINPREIRTPKELRRWCEERDFLYRFLGLYRRHSHIMDCDQLSEFMFVLQQVDAGAVLHVVPYGAEHNRWKNAGREPVRMIQEAGADEVRIIAPAKTHLSGQRVTDGVTLRRAYARGCFLYQLHEPLSGIYTCKVADYKRIAQLEMQVKKRAIIIHPPL